MWNLKPEIGPRRLRQIFIPGTHDSSAYGEYNENVGDTLVKKYSITQVFKKLSFVKKYTITQVFKFFMCELTKSKIKILIFLELFRMKMF